jgi:uncharacterized protein (TIGR02145 family)
MKKACFGTFFRLMLLVLMPLLFASCSKEDSSNSEETRKSCLLLVRPNSTEYGDALGSGTYLQGDTAVVEAVPFLGYYFIRWSDGDAANPRTLVVEGDTKLYALFSDRADDPNPYNPDVDPAPEPDPEDPVPADGWVDLGLPSGRMWAACNVGASAPEDCGDYFAWGEIQSKESYEWNTYLYGTDYNKLIKYCNNAFYGLDGYTDELTTLQPGDDVATARLGGGAHIPSQADWVELMDNTTYKWTSRNGVSGCRFTASNGNSIFLPAAGYRSYTVGHDMGSFGDYWSSTLSTGDPSHAYNIFFGVNKLAVNDANRSYGFSVRPVR